MGIGCVCVWGGGGGGNLGYITTLIPPPPHKTKAFFICFILLLITGKFVPSKGACFIPWKGKELQCNQYDLLCHRRKQSDRSYIYSPSRPYLHI